MRSPSGDSTFARPGPLIYPFIYWQVNIASLKSFPSTEIQIIFKNAFSQSIFPHVKCVTSKPLGIMATFLKQGKKIYFNSLPLPTSVLNFTDGIKELV